MNMFKKKTPGAAVDKIINNLGSQVHQLDKGIAELCDASSNIDAEIDRLYEQQKEHDRKIDVAFELRNELAAAAGMDVFPSYEHLIEFEEVSREG